MADLVKTVTKTNAGEGSNRNDITKASTNRKSTRTEGKQISMETVPAVTQTTKSTPGKSTAVTTEQSPERISTETREPTVSTKVSEPYTQIQKTGEQKSETLQREDKGISVTFKLRVTI